MLVGSGDEKMQSPFAMGTHFHYTAPTLPAGQESVMIKVRYAALAALVLLLASTSLHAQGGCVNSPEAPTTVLVLVGSVGIFYGSSVVRKVLHRFGKR